MAFSNQRTRRNDALTTLLVWLFALASGMANACLLETPGTHTHVAAQTSVRGAPVHDDEALAHHSVAADAHDDGSNVPKKSCLKACDDGSKGLVKLQSGVDLNYPGLAPLVVFTWDAATPVVSAPSRFDELQVPVVGPPLRLRYLRLTL